MAATAIPLAARAGIEPRGSIRPMTCKQIRAIGLALVGALVLNSAAPVGRCAPPKLSPEARAIKFLSQEVKRWRPKNGCYSCHNNGDAARALFTAAKQGFPLKSDSLRDTRAWLVRPDDWKHNGGEGPFSDKQLANIQFAAALRVGIATGQIRERAALEKAALLLIADQRPDGSWKLGRADAIGSAATYGSTLATVLNHRFLRFSGSRFRPQASRAADWIRRQRSPRVLECSALLLSDQIEQAQRRHCLEVLRRGQTERGAWGPYVQSAGESFDTALALIALSESARIMKDAAPSWIPAAIRRGRTSLLKQQTDSGNWPETTRPAGDESYAQRISTTAWALLALLRTR